MRGRTLALAVAIFSMSGCERDETSHNARRTTLPDEEIPQSVMATAYDFRDTDKAFMDLRKFVADEHWSQALGAAQAILEVEPGNVEAQKLLAQAKLEGDSELRHREFTKRVNARDLPGAVKAFRQIADTSIYRQRAQPELTRIQELWIGATEAETRAAVRSGRCDDARRSVRLTGELFPEDKERIEQIASGCKPAKSVAVASHDGDKKGADGDKPVELAAVVPVAAVVPEKVAVPEPRPEAKPAEAKPAAPKPVAVAPPVAPAPAKPTGAPRSTKLVTMPDLEKLRVAGQPHPELPGNIKRIMLRDQREVRAMLALVVCVNEQGSVSSVQVKRPSEWAEVNSKVLADVRGWRFRPFVENGTAIPVCTGTILQYRVTN